MHRNTLVTITFIMTLALPAMASTAMGNHGTAQPAPLVPAGRVAPPSTSVRGLDVASKTTTSSNAEVYTTSSSPYGLAYQGWTARFWQWFLSIPLEVNPLGTKSDVTGAINQQGPVWFVSGGASVVNIPQNKAILAQLFTYINDYPCPGGGFEPAPGQALGDFLQDGAVAVTDLVTVADADLDGVALPVSRVASDANHSPLNPFAFTAAGNMSTLDPCISGSPQLGASDGYWVFLGPLPVGTHVLHTHVVIPAWNFDSDVTVSLVIVP